MKWLWSPKAIEVHLLFLAAIGVLTCAVVAGERGPAGDYPLALAFCAIAYPVVLFLVWLRRRISGGSDF